MDNTVGVGRCARFLLWLIAVAFFAPSTMTAQGTPAQASDYSGVNVCSDCHFVIFQQFQKTSMSVVLTDKYPLEQRGCEGICHGPGRVHAEVEWAKREAEERAKRTPPPTPIPSEAELKEMAQTWLVGPPGRWRFEKTDAEAEVKDQIYNPIRFSPKESSAACLSCHEKDEKASLFRRSRHLGAGVSCSDCHSAHRVNLPGENEARISSALEAFFSVPKRALEHNWLDNRLVREEQPKLCYSCHRDVEAQFQLPVRHRVNEGVVKCTDCHNPHGSLTPRELNATGTEACYSCHVEKKGPFVYEHASVRVEGCTSCHTPHGSINLHLLKRRQERQLCLECHVAPQSTNVPHPRLGFQTTGECTRCHIEIHGSNYQKQFLR